MTALYRFDSAQSAFQVQAFAAGLLSFVAHSPTFAVREFLGTMTIDGESPIALEMTILAESLALVDRVSDADRKEIMRRMREEVLETGTFHEIAFRSNELMLDRVDVSRSRVRINGQLSLHGVSRSHRMNAEMQLADTVLRLIGETPLHMSDYKVKPVSAVGGTIKLKDELKVSFDLKGLPEVS